MYRARFRARFCTVEALKQEFGRDGELHKLFAYWCDLAVKCMQEAQSHNCRITWGTESTVWGNDAATWFLKVGFQARSLAPPMGGCPSQIKQMAQGVTGTEN